MEKSIKGFPQNEAIWTNQSQKQPLQEGKIKCTTDIHSFWPKNSNQSWQHWSKLPSLSSILVVLSFLQQQAVFRSAFFPTFIALTYFRDHVKKSTPQPQP